MALCLWVDVLKERSALQGTRSPSLLENLIYCVVSDPLYMTITQGMPFMSFMFHNVEQVDLNPLQWHEFDVHGTMHR